MKRWHLLFFCLFSIQNVNATQYVPVPLEIQVDEADAVVHGIFQGKTYKKLPSGQVVTQASFSLIESAGLYPGEVLNKNNFLVTYPGGVWQGLVYKVIGAPTFYAGEEVVLLLNKKERGYVIKDVSMGKYSVRRTLEDGEILSSSIFSDHPKLGKIKKTELDKLLKNRFGGSFLSTNSDSFVYKKERKNRTAGREIASIRKGRDESETPSISTTSTTFWIAILFGTLGGFRFFVNRRKKRP